MFDDIIQELKNKGELDLTNNEIRDILKKRGFNKEKIKKIMRAIKKVQTSEKGKEIKKQEIEYKGPVKEIEFAEVAPKKEGQKKESGKAKHKILYEFLFIFGLVILTLGYFNQDWIILFLGLAFMFVSLFIYELSSTKHPEEKERLRKFFRYLSFISIILALGIVSYVFIVNRNEVVGLLDLPLGDNLFFYCLFVIFIFSLLFVSLAILKGIARLAKKKKEKGTKAEIKQEAKKEIAKTDAKEQKEAKKHFFANLFRGKEKQQKEEKPKAEDKKEEIKKEEKKDKRDNKILINYVSVFVIALIIFIASIIYKEWVTSFIAFIAVVTSLYSYVAIKKEMSKAKSGEAKKPEPAKEEIKLPFVRRSLGSILLLDIITLGIYFFYWYYTVNKEIKEHMKLNINLRLYLWGMFVPGLNFYLFYKTAAMVGDMQHADKLDFEIKPVTATISIIVPFFYQFIVQSNINKHLDVHTGKVQLKEVIFEERRGVIKEEKKKLFEFFRKRLKGEEFKETVERSRVEIKPKPYETDLDVLKRLVDEKGKIKVIEVSRYFGISKELAEEWGKILEEHGLAKLHYPAIGGPELQKWKKQ